jgi:hypothetical protein
VAKYKAHIEMLVRENIVRVEGPSNVVVVFDGAIDPDQWQRRVEMAGGRNGLSTLERLIFS